MNDLKVMFSSKSDEWATPQAFFDKVNEEFEFDLDVCATDENHKCDKYFTMQDNGLEKSWGVGTQYGAIHLIVKLINGLKRLFTKQSKKIHWLQC